MACVKGLAEAVGKPAMGISNLQVISCFGTALRRAVVLDARRGEVYGAVYDSDGKLVMPEMVAKIAAWLETLPEGDLEFISTDFTEIGDALAASRFADAPRVTAPRALAGAIGRLAAARVAGGEAPDPAALDANYVRRSDAELFWKE